MSMPTNEDFATEVKSDRLKTLYQFTIALCLVFLIFIVTFNFSRSLSNDLTMGLFLADVTVIGGCLLTRWILLKNRFRMAAWAFALSGVAAVCIILLMGDKLTYQIVPFVFPVIVFLVGLMLPPMHTFVMSGICSLILLIAPLVAPADIVSEPIYPIFSILLMFLSAGLSSQVTGELHQITEWALMNYQRERRTNDELFEKRLQLQRSLKRSEALSDELRNINKQLEAARAAAEEAKKFRGQFLANMSHELRTPLNAIIGFSETMLKFPMMYDNQPLPDAYESDVSQIFNSGRQLLHVINDILDLSKVDAGKLEIRMQAVDIGPIINAVISTARGLIAGRPIALEKNVPEVLPQVWADETRLRQVLLNLYSNAVKYTDEGEIELTVKEIGDEVQFSVRDTGIGIPEKFHSALFEEFRQADNTGRDPRSGAGLGLAISKQLLTLMGGTIWFESKVGVGSTFHFTVLVYRQQDKTGVTPVLPSVKYTPKPDEASAQEKVETKG